MVCENVFKDSNTTRNPFFKLPLSIGWQPLKRDTGGWGKECHRQAHALVNGACTILYRYVSPVLSSSSNLADVMSM